MAANPSIIIENVGKTYQKTISALQEVSFQVEKGELFGLIGPDGAGKTSLIRILTTLLLADTGKASVEGWDVVKDYRDIRRHSSASAGCQNGCRGQF